MKLIGLKNSQYLDNWDWAGTQRDQPADSKGLDRDTNSKVLAPPAPAPEQSPSHRHVGSRDRLASADNNSGDNCFL